jgi:hypothetical protein
MPLRYVLVLLLVFRFSSTLSQARPPIRWGVNAYYGFVFRHTPKIGAITNTHPYAAEVYLNWPTTGSKAWHRLHLYPEPGAALGVVDFHHPKLGQIWYGITYLEKPFTLRRASGLRLRIGGGLSWSTRPYHPENNFQNAALSSRVNYTMRGELAWAQRLSDAWTLKTGLMITHFSNAAYKVPNSGINVIGWSLGVSHLPHPERLVRSDADTVHQIAYKPYALHVSGAFTVKEVGLPGGRKHPGGVLSAYGSRRLNAKSALMLGLDATLNTAEKKVIALDTTLTGEQKPDYKRVALTLGHELYISPRLSLLSQMGVYVYSPYPAEAPFYLRNGLKCYFLPRLFGAITLKTHYGTADFVEWTVGIKFD